MAKDWIKGVDGKNLQFRREQLLNFAMNRWGLNKAYSVGPTSDLIRRCAPRTYDEWVDFYFEHARQKKKDGIQIDREYLIELAGKLHTKLSEVVQNEIASISEEESIDYVYNLVINRTYEGYIGEIQTIYGQLEKALNASISPAPDEWDRLYNVDFHIEVDGRFIGLQVKPISFDTSPTEYRWLNMLKSSHEKFTARYGGKVFIVFSVKRGGKKVIHNLDVIPEIESEIRRLRGL